MEVKGMKEGICGLRLSGSYAYIAIRQDKGETSLIMVNNEHWSRLFRGTGYRLLARHPVKRTEEAVW
jgi:hypothetical protein